MFKNKHLLPLQNQGLAASQECAEVSVQRDEEELHVSQRMSVLTFTLPVLEHHMTAGVNTNREGDWTQTNFGGGVLREKNSESLFEDDLMIRTEDKSLLRSVRDLVLQFGHFSQWCHTQVCVQGTSEWRRCPFSTCRLPVWPGLTGSAGTRPRARTSPSDWPSWALSNYGPCDCPGHPAGTEAKGHSVCWGLSQVTDLKTEKLFWPGVNESLGCFDDRWRQRSDFSVHTGVFCHVCKCACECVRVCVSECVCQCACVYASLYASVHMKVYRNGHMSVYMSVYSSVFLPTLTESMKVY